ncbi:Hypothetical predicted protein [Podarcis lilfordi]|uniref:Uncharacterized protein n=1 Tax=Podarcis lilfordi TaxID=74358 RepID=A0AA35PC39_9SAUR|nr:Hypothetical predicted protein [Podarcis lilfordi]
MEAFRGLVCKSKPSISKGKGGEAGRPDQVTTAAKEQRRSTDHSSLRRRWLAWELGGGWLQLTQCKPGCGD